jgi:hypothetical protein
MLWEKLQKKTVAKALIGIAIQEILAPLSEVAPDRTKKNMLAYVKTLF